MLTALSHLKIKILRKNNRRSNTKNNLIFKSDYSQSVLKDI